MKKIKDWLFANEWKVFSIFCLLFLCSGDYVMSLFCSTFAILNYPWKS
jgi:hypothetical protein